MDLSPLLRGEGGPRPALSPAGAGRVRGHSLISAPPGPSSPDGFPHFAHELLWILQRQPVRNPQQAYAETFQIILFRSVFPHLAGLRVHTAIKLDRQSMLEAVEIHNPVFDAALAAKFRPQLSVAQQIPRRFFRISLGAPQFAHALGGNSHRQSITALRTAAKIWAAPSR